MPFYENSFNTLLKKNFFRLFTGISSHKNDKCQQISTFQLLLFNTTALTYFYQLVQAPQCAVSIF